MQSPEGRNLGDQEPGGNLKCLKDGEQGGDSAQDEVRVTNMGQTQGGPCQP